MTKIIEAVDMCKESEIVLKEEVNKIKDKIGKEVEFVIINASDNPANERYIRGKVADGEAIGLKVKVVKFDEDCTDEEVIDVIEDCSKKKIPVIFQLPTYEHLDVNKIMGAIDHSIDADGFAREWVGDVALGSKDAIAPATPKGVMNLLDYYGVNLEGKMVLVVGKSNHVGKPLTLMLMERGATVINANSKTKDLDSLVEIADVVIPCVGKKDLIKAECVREGAILIGIGFTYIDGKQVLDFDIDKVVSDGKASIVSNRVRCTGKATINALIENVVKLYKLNYSIN